MDKIKSLPRIILHHWSGLLKISLYLGVTYLALFTGAGTCHGQGCSYYLYRGHCSGPATGSCNSDYIDEYSGFSDCHDRSGDNVSYCWSHGCSASGEACTCVVAPTDTVTVSGSVACGVTGVGGWCSGSASVNISATDSLGHAITISPCGSNPCSVPLSEGSGTLAFSATCSGGQTDSGSVPWALDLTPPTVSGSVSGGTVGLGGYYTSGPVTLTCTGSDALSGLQGITYGAQTASGDGSHTLSCTATDNGGNTASYSQTVTIDSAPPTAALQCNGVACSAAWYLAPVSLSLVDSDATSGVGTTQILVDGVAGATVGEGAHTVTASVYDNAGNLTTLSQPVYVDSVAPVSAFTIGGGWVRGTVTVSGTSIDATSGIANVYLSLDGGSTWITLGASPTWSYSWDTTTVPDGAYTLMARSDDVAGNNEHTATVNLNVDNTAPNLNLPYSPMGYDPSKAIFLSSDAGSGLAQARVTFSGGGITPRVYTFSPLAGTETISWDGRDGSGNSVAPGTYNVLIEVWDVVGNYSSTTGQWVVVAAPAPTSTRIPWPTFTRTPSPTMTTTSLPPTKAVANTQAVSTSSPSPTNTKPASSAPVIPTIVLPPPLSGLPVWTLFLPGLIVVGWLFVNGGSFFFDRRWSEVRKLQQDVISYRKSISSIEEGDTHD